MLAEKKDISVVASGDNLPQHVIDDRKEIVVRVALRLFNVRGYGHVTISDIAKEAGVAKKEVQSYFPSMGDICHQVIEVHQATQKALFEDLNQNSNPRQRLSLYLDSLVEDAEEMIAFGCPITNLYFDVKREEKELADHGASLLQRRLDWIRQQFSLITRVDNILDLPERLDGAIHGISILAQVTGQGNLVRKQVNQLKSWIRSM